MTKREEEKRWIGSNVARANARPLLEGKGRFTDDVNLPGMLHACFVRSPFAHARVASIDTAQARAMPGVLAVVTGRELSEYCEPWTANLTNLPPMRTAAQHPMPPEVARWQGEPVVAVVAESRALAEDAAEAVVIEWEELAAVADIEGAASEGAPLVHPELGTNVAWEMQIEAGDVAKAWETAACVVERELSVGRQTGVTLEPRGVVADFHASDGTLTLHHSTQVPHICRSVYATQLGLAENRIRILCPDVGGGFGLKLHIYGDEIATAALSIILKRPVKFVADRLESFLSDIHARGHELRGKLALSGEGKIIALEVEDVAGGGAYMVYPRTSAIEPLLVAVCTPIAYEIENYRADVSLVYQNKVPTGQYRGVGMPVATLIMEAMVDEGARALGMSKAEIRKRNLRPDDAYPCQAVSGEPLEGMSQHAAMDKLLAMADYETLLSEQRALRERGIYRGIGLVSVVEGTSASPALYAAGGAPISSRDGCTIRLEADGTLTCLTGLTEQGQGGYSIIAQIVADTVGVPIEQISVVMGDTAVTPFGGGTWASRGTSIAGEAALLAGRTLRRKILEAVGALRDVEAETLAISHGTVTDARSGEPVMPLRELGQFVHFRTAEFPAGFDPELIVTRHYSQREHLLLYANCAICLVLDVDVDIGRIDLRHVWVVEDCGTVINPQLVDEQIRGGLVQGFGSALYEECLYDDEGLLRNGNLMEYLVPMAAEMPDIDVAHLETRTRVTELGAKGCGEAGMIGAPAAVMNAVNDALGPLNARIDALPITPEKVLRALGRF